jgi:hypothetical protein
LIVSSRIWSARTCSLFLMLSTSLSAKVSATRTASCALGSAAVMSSVESVPLLETNTWVMSSFGSPPIASATSWGTSPVVTSTDIWSRLVKTGRKSPLPDEVSRKSVWVAL